MYLLIFEAWAQLMGFTQDNQILWNEVQIFTNETTMQPVTTWKVLMMSNTLYQTIGSETVSNALKLAHIMTHVSLILIFIFFISFIIFLFRLFAHMLSRR